MLDFSRFRVITFDCYGTLIDWENGIADAFRRAAESDGVHIARDEVLRAYAIIEPIVEQERYRSYREVLTETAARIAHMYGWPLSYERAGFLAASLPEWKPFDDTNRALERLGAARISHHSRFSHWRKRSWESAEASGSMRGRVFITT
ncbi:MAG: hypothetical protein DMG93_13705 [Acidobacteria bacterium]|nr:MAG: hypothetical protein DMG93_13705 [Acidobacteriota bacterium]